MAESPRQPPLIVKTILAPIDFSEVTQWVMTEAVDLARKLDGHLVILNVTNPKSINEDQRAFRKLLAGLHEQPLRPTRADERAGKTRTTDVTPVSGDSLQIVGEPVPVILEVAERMRADYIVMGSHGRSRLYDLVFGSVAEGMIRNAPCPVMLVPSRGKMNTRQSTRTNVGKPVRKLTKAVLKKSSATASPKGGASRAKNARAR